MARSGLRGYTAIDGADLSALTAAKIRHVTKSVHIISMPPGCNSLDFLEPVGHVLERIVVTDWGCEDARILANFPALADIDLLTTNLTYDVGLESAPALKRFIGQGSRFYRSAWRNPSVRELGIDHASSDMLEAIAHPSLLTSLSHLSARNVDRLPAEFDSLQTFELHGAREFDLASLAATISSLRFTSVKSFTNGDHLAQLNKLRSIYFFDSGRVDSHSPWLSNLQIESGEVFGPPFPFRRSELNALDAAQRRRWRVSPGLD